MSLTLLAAALSDPALASLSDAAAAAALNVPTYTPRTEAINFVTLAGSGIWGFAKVAAFRVALTAASQSNDQQISAEAQLLLDMLKGTGFFATDPQVQAMAPAFVALSGGTITDDDGKLAVGIPNYLAGGPVTEADVTAARAQMARQAALDAIMQANRYRYNANVAKLDAVFADPAGVIPATLADLDAMGAS